MSLSRVGRSLTSRARLQVGYATLVVFALHIGLTSTASVGFSTAASSPALISTGLNNLGNTCYMNAQLQCAFHIPAVRLTVLRPAVDETEQDLAEDEEESTPAPATPKKEALIALQEVFEEMVQAGSKKSMPVMPRSFCRRLGIPVLEQQDSQEFWKLLLPATGVEALTDLYKGSFEDYITALDGSGREKRREELFLDLSLDITSSSTALDSLKISFGEPELLSEAEGNGWRPEKGADKVDAHKGSSLLVQGLPPILQLHLKRFNYDWEFDQMSKINDRFSFPEVLDLSSICSNIEKDQEDRAVYDLQSVVVHVGQYNAGHYYAYVRPDVRKDDWYRFNDDIVERVSFKEVTEDAFGGRSAGVASTKKPSLFRRTKKPSLFRRILRTFQGDGGTYGWGGSTSNAYVVQYVKRCDLPMLYPEE